MTAPTTRAELEAWFKINGALHLLCLIDTFATVCPREPTEEMTGEIADYRAHVRTILRNGIAASPFAPEKTDG